MDIIGISEPTTPSNINTTPNQGLTQPAREHGEDLPDFFPALSLCPPKTKSGMDDRLGGSSHLVSGL